MADEIRRLAPVALWPQGAPGAAGDSDEDRPRLTPYLPPASEPTAAVVVCPGGGYDHRADHEAGPVARWLASLGVAGIVLDYRVAPYRHPIPLQDAQRGIRLVRATADEWNIDPAAVGILGFSAGGHLAASTATIPAPDADDADDAVDRQSSRPDALIACYPVISFGDHGHDGSMRSLLGQVPQPGLPEYLSLESRVTTDTPPTFLWHTADDEAVPVENSLLFAAALRRCGVPFELHVYQHGPHGLGLAQDSPACREWTTACANWLREIGFAR